MGHVKDESFKYCDTDTYDNNFHRWWYANSVEREMYREKVLLEEEARDMFRKYWGYKLTYELHQAKMYGSRLQ